MTALDWSVLVGYFVLMVLIGIWSRTKIKTVVDYFTTGGKIPWWLSGISHHMSGYSAVMFVAFAAVAYTYGITVYVWWAVSIGVGVGIGAFVFAARWNRLRAKHGVVSPLEYLARRYNLPTQQALAYSVPPFRFCRLGRVVSSPVAIAKQPVVAGPATTAAGRAVAVRGAFLRSKARL